MARTSSAPKSAHSIFAFALVAVSSPAVKKRMEAQLQTLFNAAKKHDLQLSCSVGYTFQLWPKTKLCKIKLMLQTEQGMFFL